MPKNPKNWGRLMQIANIDREFLHIFWTTWGNSVKYSGKMCFKIILKVTKNEGFTLSLEDTFFEKPRVGRGVKLIPLPSPAVLGLKSVPCGMKNLQKNTFDVSRLKGCITLW